jgi:nucleoside 2-deoxyribosyltransferase
MNKKYIYLAGPITGCNKTEANDWRHGVQINLPPGLVGISPLRCEPRVETKYKLFYDSDIFGSPAAIASKNYFDVCNCDLVLAYLPKFSLGTIIEIGWAKGLRKPVVVVSEEEGIYNHPLITQSAGWVVPDMEKALDVIEGLFDGY